MIRSIGTTTDFLDLAAHMERIGDTEVAQRLFLRALEEEYLNIERDEMSLRRSK